MSLTKRDAERNFKDQRLVIHATDITIKYFGRELKAHKITLCGRCKYFERALAEDGGVKESNAAVIELNEDDPDALESMIQYIYSSDLPIDWSTKPQVRLWSHWIEVLFVADDKYGVRSLASKALSLLESYAALPQRADRDTNLLKFLGRVAQYPGEQARMGKLLF